MKKITLFIVAMVAFVGTMVAALPITKVDRVNPTDEIFMEMAIDQAKESVAEGGLPCGASVVMSNRMLGVGQATDKATAEETAIAMSRKKKLSFATVYTVNEPTAEAYNAICRAGAEMVVFVNSREDVIAKGVYPAEAYEEALVDSALTKVPMTQLDNASAAAVLKNWKK
ncbi:MAG: hypothetical protein IKZ14_09430 [Muribaculaceae bacterium]|nr:hypothetical protein [Muribaculaceae bacterium]